MGIIPPDQAWRSQAACMDADPGLFDLLSAEELGMIHDPFQLPVHHNSVRKLNEPHWVEARKICATCPVVPECDRDAVLHGDHAVTFRAGKSPYDRDDVRPGKPQAAPAEARATARLEAHEAAWQSYLRGTSGGTLSSGLQEEIKRRKREIAKGPYNASWDGFGGSWHAHEWAAGEGWVLSQDRTRSVVKVMYLTATGLTVRLANSRHVRYDSSSVPKVLVEWPEGVDVI